MSDTRPIPLRLRGPIAVSVLLVTLALPGFSLADGKYVSGPLVFETQGQGMWSPDPAFVLEKELFLGTSWNTPTITIGGISGGITHIPCVPVPVVGGCLPGTGIDIDTRTGGEASASTSGKVGFNLGARLDSGSVDATVSYEAMLDVPGGTEIEAGEFFDLNPASQFSGTQRFATNLSEAGGKVEGVLGAKADLAGTGCFIGFGCASGSTTVGFDPQTLEIISFNDPISSPGQIKILGEADPALFQFGSPIDVLTFGNVTVHVPDINTDIGLSGDMFTASGMSDFLDLRVDLDALMTASLGLPPLLGASVSAGPLSVGYDLLNVEIGPTIELLQHFELIPTLMVTLDFSQMVNVEGIGLTNSLTAPWDMLPAIALLGKNDPVTVTPTFFLDALFSNMTTLGADGVFTVEALAAAFSLEAFGLSLDVGSLGPLFSHEERGDLFDLPPLFQTQFGLGGFQPIVGDPFQLESVPEPAVLGLLGLGWVGFLLARRRRR